LIAIPVDLLMKRLLAATVAFALVCVGKGGSSGHHSVTGRSWTSSGATIASRCRPDSPPHVR